MFNITSLILAVLPLTNQISQPYEFNGLDILNNGEHTFVVQPFDSSLGTLLNVEVKITAYRWRHTVLAENRLGYYFIPNMYATGLHTVPRIHSVDNEWSMLSFTTTCLPNPGGSGERWVIPPYSLSVMHRFDDSDTFECSGMPLDWGPHYFSLMTTYEPGAEYWVDVPPIELTFRPTWGIRMCQWDGTTESPWPGDYYPTLFRFGMTYEVVYTYV